MKYSAAFPVAILATAVSAQQTIYGQCGGTGYTGATTCASGTHCAYGNPYYSQCLPGAASTTLVTSIVAKTSSTAAGSKSTSSHASATSSAVAASGTVTYAGVNIAGFDFGCGTDGTCNTSQALPPLTQYNGPDGAGQMSHFVNDDHMNIFRLPVGWQWLTNNVLGGTLDPNNFAKYDALVQACLSTGATCIVDIHNYARWNGAIVGQGGPTNAQFANIWSQVATKYKTSTRVAFGIMNEPHDVPDINAWGVSVQAAVTAIRTAGATTQLILLPGNNYTSASQYVSNGSLAAMQIVVNLDGTKTNLIFDVHKYLDSDNSGTNSACVTNNIDSAFAPLATSIRAIGRQAILTETGGGNVASCVTYLCQEIAYLNANSDVYIGYVGWAAGGFDGTYVLGETPTKSGSTWTDTLLVSSCLKR